LLRIAFCGRATRVFKAFSESDAATAVALKDQWIEDNRKREGDFLTRLGQMILKGTEDKLFEDLRLTKPPHEDFLTVVAHGPVKVDKSTDDHTTAVLVRGFSLRWSFS
jgi:hypothetical protein